LQLDYFDLFILLPSTLKSISIFFYLHLFLHSLKNYNAFHLLKGGTKPNCDMNFYKLLLIYLISTTISEANLCRLFRFLVNIKSSSNKKN